MLAGYALFNFGLARFVSREKAGHEQNSTDYFLADGALSLALVRPMQG